MISQNRSLVSKKATRRGVVIEDTKIHLTNQSLETIHEKKPVPFAFPRVIRQDHAFLIVLFEIAQSYSISLFNLNFRTLKLFRRESTTWLYSMRLGLNELSEELGSNVSVLMVLSSSSLLSVSFSIFSLVTYINIEVAAHACRLLSARHCWVNWGLRCKVYLSSISWFVVEMRGRLWRPETAGLHVALEFWLHSAGVAALSTH